MASRSSEEPQEETQKAVTAFDRRLERAVPEASLLSLVPALAARHFAAKDELRPLKVVESKKAQLGVQLPGPGFPEAVPLDDEPQQAQSSKASGKRRARTSDDEEGDGEGDDDAYIGPRSKRAAASSSKRKAPQQSAEQSRPSKRNMASRFNHSALVASAILLEELVLFSPSPRSCDTPPPRLLTPPLPQLESSATRKSKDATEAKQDSKKRRRNKDGGPPLLVDWALDVPDAQIEAAPPDEDAEEEEEEDDDDDDE